MDSSNRHHILNLPAEIREQIWIHAITTWTRPDQNNNLTKQPIRIDKLNKPLPPGLTRVNRQLYLETLHLYYRENIFECWRPFFGSWYWATESTLMFWLNSLSDEKMSWINSIVLMYKEESELESDLHGALQEEGIWIKPGVFSFRVEKSEYELCFEQMGLPRAFSARPKGPRWMLQAG